MRQLLSLLAMLALGTAGMLLSSQTARAGECVSGLCGTPNQSGGGCGCGCGSILVAMTDRGDTYQFADDFDGDGIEDEFDNCPYRANYEQLDGDGDTVGDACDLCPAAGDPQQGDLDGDRTGDACDADSDGDQIANATPDNCASVPNLSQTDTDADGSGDACDDDDDGDQVPDSEDPCRLVADADAGAAGCDDDADGDHRLSAVDNCPSVANNTTLEIGGVLYTAQSDRDRDGIGDLCDSDMDGDAIANYGDNCIAAFNPGQADMDRDGLGDAGNWNGGAESCDYEECYVVGGDVTGCLNPAGAFQVAASIVDNNHDGVLNVGEEVAVPLASNRLHEEHSWTARFSRLPSDSNATLLNALGSGSTLGQTAQVATCLRADASGACVEFNTIRFKPDAPGTYVVQVRADLPNGDPQGFTQTTATALIEAEVVGESQGCTSAGAATSLAAMAVGLLLAATYRRRAR
ncbi:MAG: thrombospondin type 3 repeat-containing protein [Myxococcota bacterium]